MSTRIAKLRNSFDNASNTMIILHSMRKKLHNNSERAQDAMRMGLTNYLIECMELSTSEHKVPLQYFSSLHTNINHYSIH
jgi:hypothetical protein